MIRYLFRPPITSCGTTVSSLQCGITVNTSEFDWYFSSESMWGEDGGRGRQKGADLPGDSDLVMLLVANRTVGLVQVVEDN